MAKKKYKFENNVFSPREIDRIILSSYAYNTKVKLSEYLQPYLISEEDVLFNHVQNIDCKSIEDAIHYFEIAIPKGESTETGAVYTPGLIRDRIVDSCFSAWIERNKQIFPDTKCADISCGCGAFLYTCALKIQDLLNCSFREAIHHVYGIDINPNSIERTKILLSIAALEQGESLSEEDFHLYTMNSLSLDSSFQTFDIIVGNPPYVRAKNIGEESKLLLSRWSVAKKGNPDLYIPFFEICTELLTASGELGLITPNTYLTSVNGRALRNYFSSHKYSVTIENFREEKVFDGKMVYTCITFINKIESDSIRYAQVSQSSLASVFDASYSSFLYGILDNHKGWFLSNSDVYDVIYKIEHAGPTLGNSFPIKNGIATLANDIFIFKPDAETKEHYLYNGCRIEKAVCKDIIKPNKLKTEAEIPELLEKVIYPYNTQYQLFDEEQFSQQYPEAYSYLKQYKDKLIKRDKGECDYPWYAFGRTQAIDSFGKKLLFPYMADAPHFVYTDNKEMLIYCGYAIFGDDERELLVLKKILESKVFDYYIKHTSKPYSGGFYAYAKNYVKDFSICILSDTEKEYLLKEEDHERVNDFIFKKYNIML